jgi:hypothetical protein
MHDLTPEDRIKFDEGYRNQKKESFIQTKIRDYYSEKNAYSIQVYAEVRDAIIKENEDNGFIFYMNDWRKPSEVVNLLIKEMRTKAVPVKNTPSDPVTVPSTSTTPEDPNATVIVKKDPAIAKKREEIKKIAEDKLLEATTKNAGIDADQGYELAYWGMKKEDFAILYPQYIASAATTGTAIDTTSIETSEIITRESGPLSKLEFYFISGLFYKVVYVFRNPNEAMLAMGNKIKDKYGFTDQEKLDASTVAKTDVPATELPLEEIYTWTGKETKGQLTIKFNSERTGYTDFILAKENPKIKKHGDELAANIESKKRREAEEQRKRNLEEYNKIK